MTEHPRLRLLSLDGGGVRGFSQLLVLERLMRSFDDTNPPKPCDVFDLIGGTGTGGLWAIMLGRLCMDVQQCIKAYQTFMPMVTKSKRQPFAFTGRIRPQYDSVVFETAIKELCHGAGIDRNALLYEGYDATCKSFVCTMRTAENKLVRMSNYPSPISESEPGRAVKIWEAARATTAAPHFFEPISVGPSNEQYIAGDIMAINPIRQLLQAVSELWPDIEFDGEQVGCIISIGAGKTPRQPRSQTLQGRLKELRGLVGSVLSAEGIADSFAREFRRLAVDNIYFRFDVGFDTGSIALDDVFDNVYVASKTEAYLSFPQTAQQLGLAAHALRLPDRDLEIGGAYRRVETMRSNTSINDSGPEVQNPPSKKPERSSTSDTAHEQVGRAFDDKDGIRDSLPETVAACVVADPTLRALCTFALDRVEYERFERNISRLLQIFARQMSSESSSDQKDTEDHSSVWHRVIIRLVDSDAANIASIIGERLKPLSIDRQSSDPPSYDEIIEQRDIIRDVAVPVEKLQPVTATELSQIRTITSTQVSAFLKDTKAWESLGHNTRTFVFPTVNLYIRANVEEAIGSSSEVQQLACRVQWQVQKYVERELDGKLDLIESVLTLTGRFEYSEASTCREYMENTWPQSGGKMLEAICDTLLHGSCTVELSSEHNVRLRLRQASKTILEGLDIVIWGNASRITESLEQIAWFGAALRLPSEGDSISSSHVDFRITAAAPEHPYIRSELFLLPLQPEQNHPSDLGLCWTPLFGRSVLAWGFPVKEREDGIGLEMPFHLMTMMSRARRPLEFQRGIILQTEFETLLPIAKLGCGVQWHRVEGPGTKNFLDVVKANPEWYQTIDLKELMASRTFLGCWSHAKVRAGTAISNVLDSEVQHDTRWFSVDGEIPLNISLRAPMVASFGASPKLVLPKSQMKQTRAKDIGYERSLERSKTIPILLYDSSSRTGWLVPELSVVLHLALAKLSRMQDGSKHTRRLRYARPLADGGAAALEAIKACEKVELWKKTDEEDKPFRFGDLIADFMDLLDNRRQEQQLKAEAKELKAMIAMRGWDFADLRDDTHFFAPRKLSPPRFSGPPKWWQVGRDAAILVIFGRNFGQLITPDRIQLQVCSTWTSIPPEKELMCVTVICLREICRRFSTRLPRYYIADEVVWHHPVGSRLFGACSGNCNPVQSMWEMGAMSSLRRPGRGQPNNPGNLVDEGAIVFGKPKSVIDHVRRNLPCHALAREATDQWTMAIIVPHGKKFNLVLVILLLILPLYPAYWLKGMFDKSRVKEQGPVKRLSLPAL